MIGIIVFSFSFFFLSLFPYNYEIQFHTVKIHNKLDYSALEKFGIKKIIFRVFQDEENEGGLYFTNSNFKVIEPSLEKLIDEFDFKKLQLCAWMMTRKFNWVEDLSIMDYEFVRAGFNGKSEDSIRLIRKLDIYNPQAIEMIVQTYKELASHKIDAILIQDDLILRYNEGFSRWGKMKFQTEAGVPAVEKLMMEKDSPYNLAWNQIKVKQVCKVLRQIVDVCKRVNSNIKMGINVYYETPISDRKAEAWYGHNLKAIADTGVDFIYLMSYQQQIKDEMKLNDEDTRSLFKQIVDKAFQVCKEKLIVKIQVRDWKTSERIPVDEIKQYLKLIPEKVERICFTPILPSDIEYLQDILCKNDEIMRKNEKLEN